MGEENAEFYFRCVNVGMRKHQTLTLEKEMQLFNHFPQNQNLLDWVENKVPVYAAFIKHKAKWHWKIKRLFKVIVVV